MGTITSNGADALQPTVTNAAHSTTRPSPPPQQQQPPSPSRILPDEPVVVIEPSKTWTALNLRALWSYRELLYFLTWRDIKVRYKQTALGMAWVVMQPLLTTAVFTIFLGRLAGVRTDGIPYPLFAYAGLLPWMFFMGAITSSSNSLVSNAHLITKVYFPRSIVPLAAVAARLPDFAIAFIVLIGMVLYYGVAAGWNVLLLPVCVALMTLLALGVGMATSALNVKYRDVGVMMPLLLQLWMFASPVVYPSSLVPEEWRRLYSLNPMVGIIEGFRVSLLGGQFDRAALAVSALFTLALLVCAAFWFRRMETHFADIV
jgi:lipopolysaccharide transport system permease protein